MREAITLSCGECHRRNYYSSRNKKVKTEKVVLKKFCRFCGKRTEHKETK